MNVLIISTNRSATPAAVMPVGACIVAEAAERAGHDVRVLDLMFERNPITAVESILSTHSPDVVGLSVRNIDNNDMGHPVAYVDDLCDVVAAVRRRTDAPIVLGGAAVGVMPEALLRQTGADVAVVGDGEAAVPELLDALAANAPLDAVSGAAWIDDDAFRFGKTGKTGGKTGDTNYDLCPRFSRFSPPPTPRFDRWLDVRKYVRRLSPVPVQTKRGCPFECVYCTYPLTEGRAYCLYDPDAVVAAIEAYVSRGLRDIEFVDNVFNAPLDHALAVCDGLAAARCGARVQTVELAPQYVDDRLLDSMARAGFNAIGITAESASDRALRGLGKAFSAAEVHRAAEAVARQKLPCIWVFLLGGPGETEQTVQETLDFAARCIRPTDVACLNVGIRVYPGTRLEAVAREQGVLTRPAGDMLDPVFYVSPDLDPARLRRTVHDAIGTHPNYMNVAASEVPWLGTVYRAAYALGIREPLWRHTRLIRRVLRLLGRDIH